MGRVYRPWYTKPDGKGGRVKVFVKDWYVEYTDAGGEQRRERIGRDRRTAESALARLQEQAVRNRLGIPDPIADANARQREISALLLEYLDELTDRDTSDNYRKEVSRNLKAIVSFCRWHIWADITEPGLLKFLAKKRKDKSPATANAYLRSAKGFANWYADRLNIRSPFKGVKPYNEEVNRKRSRRVLSDAELEKLIAGAEAAPRRWKCIINGGDRAALYRVAAYTGLRVSELASLTVESFALRTTPPTVTVEARDSKGRRLEQVPLHDSLVKFLMQWLPGRRGKLWPGKWAEHRRQIRWVERDSRRAELGPGVTFHSLRRQFVTRLVRSKADVDEVRRLARHQNVTTTLKYYVDSSLPQLAKTLNSTKPLA